VYRQTHIRMRVEKGIRLLSAALLLGGMGGIVAYLWMCADGLVYQAVQHHYLEGTPSHIEAEFPQLVKPALSGAPPIASRSNPFRSLMRPDPGVLGRLEVPRLNLNVIIREGYDMETLRRAVGHIPATAQPGGPGNFVVTGHRDTFFRPLRGIARGDEIRAITRHNVSVYRVYALSVVSPDDTHVLKPTRDPECTLITCFPFDQIGPASRRLIVQARLVDRTARAVSDRGVAR
jgi:LPXTG-site transpeptidase (sortase) family protein